ncbi:Transducin beta-like protein 2 [Auxenochlorella protothecoides]|uniref:Transducin beta-like protein 2 n=1 Tax=Auxenochlorella protothecoides TaxID=3075 RepID=A0A087SIG5_AUXPR|nr:Transducin beta-like protein 2 [Auxenochlorella protothecoides]KFM25519.1 Transducin beta-like protein 2 [Auxenochlorella protothecoides]
MAHAGEQAAGDGSGLAPATVAVAVVIAGSAAVIVVQLLRSILLRVAGIYSTPKRGQRPAAAQHASTTPGTGLKSLMKQAALAKRAAGPDFVPDSELHLASLRSTTGAVLGLAWSADGDALAAATDGGSLQGASDVAFGAGPSSLAVLTRGEGGAPAVTLLTLPRGPHGDPEPAWTRHGAHAAANEGRCLEASAGSKAGYPIIISSSNKTDIHVYSGTGEDLGTIDTGGFENYAAAVSSDGRWVAAATFTNDIYEVAFDRQGTFTGLHKAMALKGHAARVLALAFSPDLGRCATASADGTLRLWNIGVRYALAEDPKLLATARLPLALDPKLRARLAWGAGGVIALSNGHRLAFFDEAGADLLASVPDAHTAPIAALAWCPGRLTALERPTWTLATGGGDARVRLWRSPERSAGRRV